MILFFFLVITMLLVSGAISSAGEHYIDIVGVTGSIPVSPTTRKKGNVLSNHSNHDRHLNYTYHGWLARCAFWLSKIPLNL